MSYSINVYDISQKFFTGDENEWRNLTAETIADDDELVVSMYEDAGYPLDDKEEFEAMDLEEKAEYVRSSGDLYHLMDAYYPIMSYVHVLQYEPRDDDIADVAKNAPNVVVIKDGDGNYFLGLSGGGMDLSEELAYAYMVIDRDVPKCFRIDDKPYCINEEAHKALVEFIKERG